ncbi:MAG: SDR family NAD(P)-dependent oxidoreductase [Pseudonocardia sp.]
MPDQTGRTVLVTGATSGLGLHSAIALAAAGARVLLTAREPARGEVALARVREEGGPGGGLAELVALDLADLASVRRAAAQVRERTADRLDVLMNNAGIMGTPHGTTVDGFELQIGTNHHGHAALTWLLMPALRGAAANGPPAAPPTPSGAEPATPLAARPARVVTVSSLTHRGGWLDLDDLHFRRHAYVAAQAYSRSKLANLLFAAELDRRLRAHGDPVLSVAAHPGVADTELIANSMRRRNPLLMMLSVPITSLFSQDVRKGMLPQLYAATAPGVRGGEYYGPGGPAEMFGHPAPAARSAAARDEVLARRLWEITAAETGIRPDPA